jgi:hypothetical protein
MPQKEGMGGNLEWMQYIPKANPSAIGMFNPSQEVPGSTAIGRIGSALAGSELTDLFVKAIVTAVATGVGFALASWFLSCMNTKNRSLA